MQTSPSLPAVVFTAREMGEDVSHNGIHRFVLAKGAHVLYKEESMWEPEREPGSEGLIR